MVKYVNNSERLRADWEFWKNIPNDRATIEELVMLSLDLDPQLCSIGNLPDQIKSTANQRLNLTLRSARNLGWELGVEPYPEGKLNCLDFVKWSQSLDPRWELPEHFPGLSLYLNGPRPEALALNNPTHPYYAKELEIANRAWTALYADLATDSQGSKVKPKKGYTRYTKVWLGNHYPDLSESAKDRITTLINPDPKGGAPSP